MSRRAAMQRVALALAAIPIAASSNGAIASKSPRRPIVLFLHSLAGSPAHWRLQTAHLRDMATVSVPSWPGHGDVPLPSGAPSFEAVAAAVAARLDRAGGRKLVLVGHSAGASVALALANRLGDTVGSLFLVDPSGDMRHEPPDETKRTNDFLAALRSEAYVETVQSYWRGALRDAKPATAALVLRDLAAARRETVVYCMEAFRRFDPGRHLAELRCPVQAIFSPLNAGPGSLADQHPNLAATFLHGVSHWLHMDAPERFNELLDEVIGRVST